MIPSIGPINTRQEVVNATILPECPRSTASIGNGEFPADSNSDITEIPVQTTYKDTHSNMLLFIDYEST